MAAIGLSIVSVVLTILLIVGLVMLLLGLRGRPVAVALPYLRSLCDYSSGSL